MDFCCDNMKKWMVDYKEAPVILKEDFSLDFLGRHEPFDADVPTALLFSFCPFCGINLIQGGHILKQ